MGKEIWVKDKRIAEKFNFSYLENEADVARVEIKKFDDLKKVSEVEKKGAERVFIQCSNWKVIPLENLIAYCKKIKIIAEVRDLEEAKLALQTLEKGVHGVFLPNLKESEAKELMNFLTTEG
ncbi:hypothetical protein HY570_00845, partial [Candidatus Micrarchaeota archaeon]|nr:hypothetical protein [Candidatus Micrarchaeota archaeon]